MVVHTYNTSTWEAEARERERERERERDRDRDRDRERSPTIWGPESWVVNCREILRPSLEHKAL
jgi:hypothetical protein